MAGLMRVPRTRGAFSGMLLVLLGAWGALIPFIGPYFDFSFTPRPDSAWHYTSDRLWLSILPGAAAFLGGLIVLASANRAMAMLGGWLAAAAGAWFVVGPNLSPLDSSMPDPGTAVGGTTRTVLEVLTFYFALGAAIIFLAALALGRFAVVGVREIRQAEERDELARSDSAAGTTAATGAAAGTAATRPASTTRESDTWTEPAPAAPEGRHEAVPGRTAEPAPSAQNAGMTPMPPPAEGEKVGAGAGTGNDHHRRIFHRRHHDDEA